MIKDSHREHFWARLADVLKKKSIKDQDRHLEFQIISKSSNTFNILLRNISIKSTWHAEVLENKSKMLWPIRDQNDVIVLETNNIIKYH